MGADIAAGNHAENGNWALFDMAANEIKIKEINGNFSLNEKFQLLLIKRIEIEIKIKISPIRFEMIVIDPDLADEWFW